MLRDELIQNRNVRLAIALKTNQLRREQLSSLTYQHVESALIGKWRFVKNVCLHEAIQDIFSLTANEVVVHLSAEATILSRNYSINDFDDLFGGDKQ